jgi:thioesterase domain-containing protein
VENLARHIRDDISSLQSGTIVELRGEGSKPPLFVVHPTGGSVHWYADLAKTLGDDRPVLGLQARGLDGKEELDTTIESMASRYVDAIIRRYPSGPYNIAGWSLGVIIAYEVARQLRVLDKTVSLLAILDQGPEVPIKEEPADNAELLFDIFSGYFPLDLEYMRSLDGEELYKFVLKKAKRAGIVPQFVRLQNFRHYLLMNKTQTQAWRGYKARPFDGRITLIRSEELKVANAPRPDLGWGTLALGGVDIVDVPGDHISMMQPPHVQTLAERLRETLGEFQTVA